MAFGEFLAGFAGAFQQVSQQRFQNQLLERQQQQQEKEFERNTQLAGMRMEFEKQRVEQDAQQFELDQKRRKIEIDALTRATGMANVKDVEDMVNGLSVAKQKQKFFEDRGMPEQATYQKFLGNQITARMKGMGPSLFGGQAPPQTGGYAAAEAPVQGAEAPPMQGAAPPPAAGGVPDLQAAPGAPAPPAGQPQVPPKFGTSAFYKRIEGIKPGTPEARFTTPEGTTFQVVDTEEEAAALMQKQKQMAQQAQSLFEGDAALYAPPQITPISKVEARQQAAETSKRERAARVAEVQGRQVEELQTTAENQNAINTTIRNAKGTAQVNASENGVVVSNFLIDNMPRERQALENLAENGQLNRPILEGYNNAFGEAVDKALKERPEISEALAQVSPGEYRIREVSPSGPNANLQARAQITLGNLVRMSETFDQNGIPPTIRIRQSNPAELVGDFVENLPEGSRLKTVQPVTGFGSPRTLPVPKDPSTVDEVQNNMAKLSASIARSLHDIPPAEREPFLQQARARLTAAMQTHWLGQSSGGFITSPESLPVGSMGGAFVTPEMREPGPSQRAKGVTESFRALQSILGKPEPSAPGKPTSMGGIPGMAGHVATAGMMLSMGMMPGGENAKPAAQAPAPQPPAPPQQAPAPKQATPPKEQAPTPKAETSPAKEPVASPEKPTEFVKTLGSIGANTKDKNTVAQAAVGTMKGEYGKMNDEEKKAAQKSWQGTRAAWQNLGVKPGILMDLNEAVGLDRMDGLEKEAEKKLKEEEEKASAKAKAAKTETEKKIVRDKAAADKKLREDRAKAREKAKGMPKVKS